MYGLVTDNPNVMTCCERLINYVKAGEESVLSRCWAYGCMCHALNNFCEDTLKLPAIKAIKDDVFYL